MNNLSFAVVPLDTFVHALHACWATDIPLGSDKILIADLMHALERRSGWARLENWESRDDLELYRLLVAGRAPVGLVLVLSEASYRADRGAFEVDGAHLDRFAADHVERFGESMFNGDLLIVSPDQCWLWVFHHEGMYLAFDLRQL